MDISLFYGFERFTILLIGRQAKMANSSFLGSLNGAEVVQCMAII